MGIKLKQKICKGKNKAIDVEGCGDEKYIYGHGLCSYCYCKWKSNENKKKRTKYIITGEKALFDKIFEERVPVSFLTGKSLNEFKYSPFYLNMFAHVLNKKDYPKFRLEEFNIVLLTPLEHGLMDNGTEEQRISYCKKVRKSKGTCDWSKIEDLKQKLLIKYTLL